ncbi:hypothetical protein GCM10009661_44460 [Catellatospora chokoriensis]|uniref:Uncharacterized protein n=1 Tax=Catellatospora chokoriensis TaxID=310353 RepID=A0A8J3K478_9ACTN|nr:hypothetical protein Cch02nite_55810 [Catellatospora chokoriensis]
MPEKKYSHWYRPLSNVMLRLWQYAASVENMLVLRLVAVAAAEATPGADPSATSTIAEASAAFRKPFN